MNSLIKKYLSCALVCVCSLAAISVQASDLPTSPLSTSVNIVSNELALKDKFIKSKYASAENRFLQGNIKASYDDYNELISKTAHDDYVFIVYAMKMAEYGFYDLSDKLFAKLDNNLYTKNYVNDIRKYYYPSSMVDAKDILYLADAYASIVYNNLAIETTSELLNSNQASDSDYKNYLIALGYYKSNNLAQALKYVNNAIMQNDINVNYKILRIKILADTKKTKLAVNELKKLQNVNFLTSEFQTKIKAVEEYVKYKIAKEDALKDYHLAYYYHLQEKSLLATKVLQGAILQAKQFAPQIFGLLSAIYFETEDYLKAEEYAQRAYKEDKKNDLALITLADLKFNEGNFDDALNYYKMAQKNTKNLEASIGVAKTYLEINKDNKSKKMYEKLLKKNASDADVLLSSLRIFPQRADEYLPIVVSVDVLNNDVWLSLAKIAINDSNYSMAETFLNNSYYIDENNYKYYYYLSLLHKAKGDVEKSKKSLIKCSELNSNYESKVNMGQCVYGK